MLNEKSEPAALIHHAGFTVTGAHGPLKIVALKAGEL